jgi:hypothetical protein
MRRSACVFVILLLAQGAAWAGDLDIFGKFFAGGAEFDLALYADGNKKVGVIGIAAADGRRTSIAFAPEEWHFFAELWQKARKTKSSTWQPVGSFKETDTKELALLTLSSGPGVQFNVTGDKGPFVFTLPAGDVASFDAKIAEMAKKLR